MYGLNGLLPTGQVRGVRRGTPSNEVHALLRERLGHEIRVNVLRLDSDKGHIFVSEHLPGGYQLPSSELHSRCTVTTSFACHSRADGTHADDASPRPPVGSQFPAGYLLSHQRGQLKRRSESLPGEQLPWNRAGPVLSQKALAVLYDLLQRATVLDRLRLAGAPQ